jgi:hypothetical protein
MATLITQSIDVTKITKSKLREGKYLDITTNVEDATNKFGQNVSTYESQTKEEREAKAKRTYIGNGKVVWTDGTITVAEKQDKPKEATQEEPAKDLPF